MTCNCPKCRAEINVDVSDVTEEGSTTSCPLCNARFSVHRENFGGRAFRKTGDISCARCGSLLGPETHCYACGRPFPDYVVAALNRKKAGPAIPEYKAKVSLFQKRIKKSSGTPSSDFTRNAPSAKPKPVMAKLSQRKKTVIASVLGVIVAAAIGGAFYVKKQAEAAYLKSYSVACYGIQLSEDKSFGACQKLATDWKAKTDAGQTFIPRIPLQDENELRKLVDRIGEVKAELAKEPGKFKGCNDQLAKLEAPMIKMRTLAFAPGNSLPAFTESASKIDAEYKGAAAQFKASLPEEVTAALREAAKRYRGLRPLVQ